MGNTRKILIDLGAYIGDTIDVATKLLGNFDEVHAFEPLARPCAEMKRRFPGDNYHIYHAAGDTEAGESRVYVGHVHGDISSSLYSDNPNYDVADFEEIRTIDFPNFLVATCKQNSEDCHVRLR